VATSEPQTVGSLARDAGDQLAVAHWVELLARLNPGERSDRN